MKKNSRRSKLFGGVAVSMGVFISLLTPAGSKPIFESGSPAAVKYQSNLHQLSFHIQKLSCASCAKSIEEAMAAIPGVRYAKVELHLPWDADGMAIYDSRVADPRKILSAIRAQRYYESAVADQKYPPQSRKNITKP